MHEEALSDLTFKYFSDLKKCDTIVEKRDIEIVRLRQVNDERVFAYNQLSGNFQVYKKDFAIKEKEWDSALKKANKEIVWWKVGTGGAVVIAAVAVVKCLVSK